MISEIGMGLESIKGALSIVKMSKELKDGTKLNSTALNIYEKLFEAHEKILLALDKVTQIQGQVAELEEKLEQEMNKNHLRGQYALIEPRVGVFTYQYQPIEGETTPVHQACPNCFAEKLISTLQRPSAGKSDINCPKCNFTYDTRTESDHSSLHKPDRADGMSF